MLVWDTLRIFWTTGSPRLSFPHSEQRMILATQVNVGANSRPIPGAHVFSNCLILHLDRLPFAVEETLRTMRVSECSIAVCDAASDYASEDSVNRKMFAC